MLQRHHYIPQRIKKTDHYVYVCEKCHKRIHPENDIIIRIKSYKMYHDTFKKFIKKEFPEVWEAWKPTREQIKKEIKEISKELPEIKED